MRDLEQFLVYQDDFDGCGFYEFEVPLGFGTADGQLYLRGSAGFYRVGIGHFAGIDLSAFRLENQGAGEPVYVVAGKVPEFKRQIYADALGEDGVFFAYKDN